MVALIALSCYAISIVLHSSNDIDGCRAYILFGIILTSADHIAAAIKGLKK